MSVALIVLDPATLCKRNGVCKFGLWLVCMFRWVLREPQVVCTRGEVPEKPLGGGWHAPHPTRLAPLFSQMVKPGGVVAN
jgi:hypothetical protein